MATRGCGGKIVGRHISIIAPSEYSVIMQGVPFHQCVHRMAPDSCAAPGFYQSKWTRNSSCSAWQPGISNEAVATEAMILSLIEGHK